MTGTVIFVIYAFAVLITMAVLAGTVALFVMAAGTALRERFSASSISEEVKPQSQADVAGLIDMTGSESKQRKAA